MRQCEVYAASTTQEPISQTSIVQRNEAKKITWKAEYARLKELQ